MNFKKALTMVAAGAAILTAGLAMSPGAVSAHHPILSATTSRPCGPDAKWTATVKAESDGDFNKDWRNQHRINNGGWSASSAWSAWVDDQVDYLVPQITDIPASRAFVVVEVTSQWRNKGGSGGEASATRSIQVNRPLQTTCPTTTTSTTTTTTTTTTLPPTTTTTLPCEWDDDKEPGDPDCVPDVTIVAECFEIDTEGAITTYWYSITNNEAVGVTVQVGGLDVPLAPGETKLIEADVNGITVLWNGNTVTTAAELDDSSTSVDENDDICQVNVEFDKVVNGPAPGADTVYTIKVSRMVVDGQNVSYVEEITFDLADNTVATIPLPSSLNPEGIEYLIEEIDAQGAANSSVTPGTFAANGHLGETISVIIVNDFASITIDKQASTAQVAVDQPISYDLTVTNSGAADLSPVVVDDLLPLGVSYTGYSIEGGAPITCADLADAPDYVVCTYNGVLAAGATLPVITLTGTVNGSAAGSLIVNQSRAIGIYLDDTLPPGTEPPAVLTCEPTEGQVCDLSPHAEATVDSTTTTVAETTTTVADSTTTVPDVTTTILVSTTEEPTTTIEEDSLPPGPPTTQELLSEGPGGPPAPEVELPGTGGNSINLLMIAMLLFGSGMAITVATRRRHS